jgi:RNA polymerase sigma-70 factor (ECF subfamily)
LTLPAAASYDPVEMRERGQGSGGETRPVVYCLVPRDLAPRLHDQLRHHFAADPSVEVVVERRGADRRSETDRRSPADDGVTLAVERRGIRSATGRRIAERRAALVPVDAPAPLPRRAREHTPRLVFVERLEPSGQEAEDADTLRLVARFQAGDRDAFAILYMRYFDRVYGYLRIALGDPHEAEDAAQQVFIKLLGALPRYQRRRTPFRGWLFVIVRNHSLALLQRRGRVEVVDPERLAERLEPSLVDDEAPLGALDWITDRELLMFVERLPLAQRQVLMLRYLADLTDAQTAAILGRSAADVRMLQSRAVRVLRERLAAVGRGAAPSRGVRMRRWPRQVTVLRSRRWALLP